MCVVWCEFLNSIDGDAIPPRMYISLPFAERLLRIVVICPFRDLRGLVSVL